MARKWDWIFTLPTPQEVPRIDLAMLFVEATIAILTAFGVSSILLGIGKVSKRRTRSHSGVGKPDNPGSGGVIG
ncbi:MAG: hypothetical protein ACLQGU_17620 [bacterium]